jgi:hypothetical protein
VALHTAAATSQTCNRLASPKVKDASRIEILQKTVCKSRQSVGGFGEVAARWLQDRITGHDTPKYGAGLTRLRLILANSVDDALDSEEVGIFPYFDAESTLGVAPQTQPFQVPSITGNA